MQEEKENFSMHAGDKVHKGFIARVSHCAMTPHRTDRRTTTKNQDAQSAWRHLGIFLIRINLISRSQNKSRKKYLLQTK